MHVSGVQERERRSKIDGGEWNEGKRKEGEEEEKSKKKKREERFLTISVETKNIPVKMFVETFMQSFVCFFFINFFNIRILTFSIFFFHGTFTDLEIYPNPERALYEFFDP